MNRKAALRAAANVSQQEGDEIARMVLALWQAIADDPSCPRATPRCQRRPGRERIGPSAVYEELEQLLAAEPSPAAPTSLPRGAAS